MRSAAMVDANNHHLEADGGRIALRYRAVLLLTRAATLWFAEHDEAAGIKGTASVRRNKGHTRASANKAGVYLLSILKFLCIRVREMPLGEFDRPFRASRPQ